MAHIENGAGPTPVLLICEHASAFIPPQFGDLGLGPEARASHIAWDPGALGVARALSRLLDAPLVHAAVSRLVIDLNRAPTDIDSIPVRSERTDIPSNRGLDERERAARIATFYEPFHAAVDAFAEARRATGRVDAIVSIHSFTPVYHDVPRPWQIGLIFDDDARLARVVGDELGRIAGLEVGLNQPYAPADRVFNTLDRHAVRRGLAPLMIEIRNDLIRTDDGQASWAALIATPLKEGLRRL